jgi:hypothetical protein
MASTFIDTSNIANVIGTLYDGNSVRELRPEYIFDAMAQEKVWNMGRPPVKGDTMVFPLIDAYSANTAALDPTSDSIGTGATTLTQTRRSVSLEAYGDHSVVDVFEAEPEAFTDLVADVGWAVRDQGFNSINLLARTTMDKNKYSNEASGTISSTYHSYGSAGSANTIGPLSAVDIRRVYTHLRANNVQTWPDGFYRAIVGPKGSQQLRAETGNDAWRAFQNNNAAAGDMGVAQASIGTFEGFAFFVNNQVEGNGTGTITAYFMGREAVGKAVGRDLVVSPNRTLRGTHENLLIIKWNALIGYKVVRRVALHTVQHNNDSL